MPALNQFTTQLNDLKDPKDVNKVIDSLEQLKAVNDPSSGLTNQNIDHIIDELKNCKTESQIFYAKQWIQSELAWSGKVDLAPIQDTIRGDKTQD